MKEKFDVLFKDLQLSLLIRTEADLEDNILMRGGTSAELLKKTCQAQIMQDFQNLSLSEFPLTSREMHAETFPGFSLWIS